MTQHLAVAKGDELIIHSPKTGYLRAWALEDRGEYETVALLEVTINSALLPGISRLTINVNTFDVWAYDNIDVLKKIAAEILKPEFSR